jgi:cell pole-organizing protein PopZ
MNQPAKVATEPTMEEILASIRRIIADDDTGKAPPKAVEPPPPPVAARPDPVPPPPVAPTPLPPVAEPAMMPPVSMEMPDEEPPMAPAPLEPPGADVLELTESMTAVEPTAGGFQTIDAESDLVFEDRPIEPEAEPEPEPPPVMAPPREFPKRDALISSSTTAAVDSAFNTLAHTVLVQNARTLEDLVREMLRPLLKTWLDDNLPGLVERLVRAEIERVSRGRT